MKMSQWAKRSMLGAGLIGLLFARAAPAQTRIITGKVVDSLTSEAVTSGQVSVTGSTAGTTIRDDGTFTLGIPAREVTLLIRSIGFKRKDVPVPASQNSVQVSLARDYFQLEAIVVTGQATGVEKRNLANAVATVNANDLVKAPTQSIEASLAGRIAGADIQSNSGAPGGGMQVRLRGVTTMYGATTPLYVVDGVIVSDAAIPNGQNLIVRAETNGSQDNPANRIADLNPNDIASVEVLKGASAAAIYGSKAANGVILITTKRGRVGAPQFSISQRFGVSAISHKLGAREFHSMADAVATFGANAANFWQSGVVYDNEQALAGKKPLSYETSASVNGGTENTAYFASALIRHEGGIIENTYDNKQALRLNLDQSVGARLKFGIDAQAIHTSNGRGLSGNDNSGVVFYSAMSQVPSFIDLSRRPDGTFPFNPFAPSNPVQTAALLRNDENVYRFIGGGRASLDLVSTPRHSLRVLGNGGADFFSLKTFLFSPPELQYEPADGLPGSSILLFAHNLNANLNGNAVYAFKTGGSTATTSLGIQYETRIYDNSRTSARNLIGGLSNINRGTVVAVDEGRIKVKDMGVFAQEEFLTMNDRLLLTAGGRADRSSNNSDTGKWFFYPKAAASFRFPQLAPGSIDELKLRAAVGQSGNQPLYKQKFTELTGANISGLPTVRVATTTADTILKPERQLEIEAGFDATLLGGRAQLTVTGYQKRVTDILLQRGLASSSGFTTQFFNGGKMRTRGLEVELTAFPVRSSGVEWQATGTFALDRCKILDLPVAPFRSGGRGFGYSGYLAEPGKPCLQMLGNDTLANGTAIERGIGDQNQKFRLGFANDFRIKAVRFYALWAWQKGGVNQNVTQLSYDFAANAVDHEDPCPASYNCAAGETRGTARLRLWPRSSAVYYQDASFVKLREASITLDLPQSFVRRFWSGSRFARLSISGRNLITITDYPGMDPEVSSYGSQAIGRAEDLFPFPPSRSFWFSIELGF